MQQVKTEIASYLYKSAHSLDWIICVAWLAGYITKPHNLWTINEPHLPKKYRHKSLHKNA